jgi:hypothetical protein
MASNSAGCDYADPFAHMRTPEYFQALMALSPTPSGFAAVRVPMTLRRYMAMYSVTDEMFNLNVFLAKHRLPLYFNCEGMRELMTIEPDVDDYPTRTVAGFYCQNGCFVDAQVSFVASTEHLSREVYHLAVQQKGIVYFKPKVDGEYAWTLSFPSLRKFVIVSQKRVTVQEGDSTGLSFEKLPWGESSYAHILEGTPAFQSVVALERAFGPVNECIVGIRVGSMLCEYKIKDVPSFELECSAGQAKDANGVLYGAASIVPGIYECCYSAGVEGRTLAILRRRVDRESAQTTLAVKAMLTSPTLAEMRKIARAGRWFIRRAY